MYIRISRIITIEVWWSFQALLSVCRKLLLRDVNTSSFTYTNQYECDDWNMKYARTHPGYVMNKSVNWAITGWNNVLSSDSCLVPSHYLHQIWLRFNQHIADESQTSDKIGLVVGHSSLAIRSWLVFKPLQYSLSVNGLEPVSFAVSKIIMIFTNLG